MQQKFDLQEQISKAWGRCWEERCVSTKHGLPRQSWLCATDLERRVRSAAAEQLDGASYGSYGADGGYRSRVRLVLAGTSRRGVTLLDECRTWLGSQVWEGKLRCYHPSGPERASTTLMRYLPADHPETEPERRLRGTPPAERQRRRHIVHHKRAEGKLLCANETATLKKGSPLRRRSNVWTTTDQARVTCKKCLRRLAVQAQVQGLKT